MASDAKEAGSASTDSAATQAGSASPVSRKPRQGGSKHIPQYLDSKAEYVVVRKNDLRDISTFGWLEEGIGGAGMFFVSGAVWLLFALLIEHWEKLKEVSLGLLFCGVCIVFGLILLWIAHKHFQMRKTKIEDYFQDE